MLGHIIPTAGLFCCTFHLREYENWECTRFVGMPWPDARRFTVV